MNLLIDMNLSPRWVEVLNQAGFDAVHWSKCGKASAPDTEIMSYAVVRDMVVLTNDLDYTAILAASGESRPSVVQVRSEDLSPESIAEPLITALRHMTSMLEGGALVSFDPRRTRVRVLPLRTPARD